MKWLGLVALVAAAVGGPAVAAAPNPERDTRLLVTHAVQNVKHAFSRRAAIFNTGTYDQSPAATAYGDLFPTYGFSPNRTNLSWSMTAVDADRTQACVTLLVVSSQQWWGFAQAVSELSLTPATNGCTQSTGLAMPSAFPTSVAAALVLDRRYVPTPTDATAGLELAVVTPTGASAVTKGPTVVAATLQAYKGSTSSPMTLQLTNQTALGDLALTGTSSTPGFSLLTNSCSAIPAGGSCQMQVVFDSGQVPQSVAGRVRLEFHQVAENVVGGEKAELTATLYGQILH